MSNKIIAPNTSRNIAPRFNNVRDNFYSNIYGPQFVYDFSTTIGSNRQVGLKGLPTGNGDNIIRIPFRVFDSSGAFTNQTEWLEITDGWIIDLDDTAIDLTAKTGGIIDGVGLSGLRDYFIWAFADFSKTGDDRFQGFGVTQRPAVNSTLTTTSGGALGASGSVFTFNLSNYANIFTIGSRIIIRLGTQNSATNDFNQGVITDILAHNQIEVTMDASYGAGIDTNWQNQSLAGQAGQQIRQTTAFKPYLLQSTQELYPGGGNEYAFCYMGNIQTDGSSDIKTARKRGEFYSLPDLTFTVQSENFTVTTNRRLNLSRWLPFHAKEAFIRLIGRRNAGSSTAGFVRAAQNLGIDGKHLTTNNYGFTNNSVLIREHGLIPIEQYDQTISSTGSTSGSESFLTNITLMGYEGENEF